MSLNLQSFSAKVYATMGGALALSGFTALAINSLPELQTLFYQPLIMIVCLVAELILVGVLSFAWKKLSPTTGLICLGAYSILNGASLAAIFYTYELGSIVNVFFASVLFYILLAIFGATTKLDLSKIGHISLIALIAIAVVSLINLFLHSNLITLILNIVGVLVFFALTIYDHRKVVEIANSQAENLNQYVVLMALQLYLDFVNIFLRLLSLFGKKKN